MSYNAADIWTKVYSNSSAMAYPAEGVIRVLKGSFPGLRLPKPSPGQTVLDLGFGDGRHVPLCASTGLKVSGVEISQEICDLVGKRLGDLGIEADLRVGYASDIPFDKAMFDFLLTWNSCYYMSLGGVSFDAHIREMSRVLKPNGWVICSMPKFSNFIFRNSTEGLPGYRVVEDDYFGERNGEVMRCYSDREEIEEDWRHHFFNFCHAEIQMDWFGLAYHWFVFCAQKLP